MIEKIGRNDDCPCGSGRKYKKCCQDKVVSLDTFVESKLNDLQVHFMRWAMQEHKEEIGEHLAPYYESMNVPKEAEQTLNFFASLWYMTSVKKNGTTLLEDYLEEHVPLLKNQRIQDIVSNWTKAAPSVFIIKNWAPDGYVVTEDAFTKEIRWVKSLNPDQHRSREHGLGIGTILPSESGGFVFFTTFFYVPASNEETARAATELTKALEESNAANESEYMSNSFMEVLQFFMFGRALAAEPVASNQTDVIDEAAETIREAAPVPESVSDLTPGQQAVLDAYAAYTQGREHSAEMIELGNAWWALYCERAKPILRKPQVAAAALYYLIDDVLLDGTVTQTELAKDFVIGATSISTRYRDLVETLETEIDERKQVVAEAETE